MGALPAVAPNPRREHFLNPRYFRNPPALLKSASHSETMDPASEQRFLKIALDNPDMLCSEAPLEILEEAASEAEPTKFMEEFFAAGYTGWLSRKMGRQIHPPRDHLNQAIIVLYSRAGLMNTDLLMGLPVRTPGQPFFSDEGLY